MKAGFLGFGLGATLLVSSFSCLSLPSPADKAARPATEIPVRATEPLRRQYAEIRLQLDRLDGLVGSLARASSPERISTLRQITELLEEQILRNTAEETDRLYLSADRCAGNASYRFTASLCHEQVIAARWMLELSDEAGKPSPDLTAFSRRADRLLGLLDAHFETEEKVLLPLLDDAMTPDRFRREVMEGEAPPLPPSSIPWARTYAEALTVSKALGKPILVHFSGPRCRACRKMEQVTLADAEVRSRIGQAFVPLYLDISADEESAIRFDVVGIPATQILSGDGQVLAQQLGFLEPKAFLAWLQDAGRAAP